MDAHTLYLTHIHIWTHSLSHTACNIQAPLFSNSWVHTHTHMQLCTHTLSLSHTQTRTLVYTHHTQYIDNKYTLPYTYIHTETATKCHKYTYLQIDSATWLNWSMNQVSPMWPKWKNALPPSKNKSGWERKSKSERVFETKIYEVFMSMNYHSFSLWSPAIRSKLWLHVTVAQTPAL